jgi:hypothetical protein
MKLTCTTSGLLRPAVAFALLLAAAAGCAKAPLALQTPAYQVAFEHFETSETVTFVRAIERSFPKPARVETVGGGAGHFELSIATDAPSSRVYDRLVSMLTASGYDTADVKVTAAGARSFVVDRIVDRRERARR